MSARRLAFARARRPVAVAMRVVAAALAEAGPRASARRSVFTGRHTACRVPARREGSVAIVRRGCEDLQ